MVVLSVAFGLGHALQGWDAAIATGTLGAFWAIVYLRRRSSIAPIISHAGFNSIEVLRVAMGGGGETAITSGSLIAAFAPTMTTSDRIRRSRIH